MPDAPVKRGTLFAAWTTLTKRTSSTSNTTENRTRSEAVEVILAAIEKAGYRPGHDISICLDPATSEMWKDGRYEYFKSEKGSLSSDEMIALWKDWTSRYPIVLLEDPLGERDWDGWEKITADLGSRLELVGDDLLLHQPGHSSGSHSP
jgi:enolase